MTTDVQRQFFIFEFYSKSEGFLRSMTAAIIALLGVVLAQSFFSVGGVDAQFLVYTFGLLVLAVGAQFLVFWARIGRGFRISGITSFFFPWLALLAIDAFFLSETPWRAQYALCVNLLPVMAFFVAIHVSRSQAARWWLISMTAALMLFSGLVEFLRPGAAADVRLAGGGSIGESVRRIFGSFGNTASIGAVLLLVFFALAFLVFSARFKLWARFFGAYMSALFLLGIAFTRHVGVYLGFVAGCALAALLLVRRRSLRLACFAVLAACAFISVKNSDADVGFLKSVPASARIQQSFPEAAELAGTRFPLANAAFEMFREHPVFGVGGGRFRDEFEKYRPPQWQTNPRTPGSLFLLLLAEHGIVGIAVFCAPLIFLLATGVRACRKMPWMKDTARAALRRKMGILDFGSIPEERITLAGTLSGLLAVGVLFAVDYPQNTPGVSIACAIFGGIAAFLLSEKHRRMIIYSGARRHWLLPVAFLVPVILLFLFLPIFRAESECQKGREAMAPFFRNALTGKPAGGEKTDFRELDRAEEHLRAAIRKAPGHGDAWNALAEKYVFDCQRDPANTPDYGRRIRAASERAMELSAAVPAFYRTRAVAEMMTGDFGEVKSLLDRADAIQPYNAPGLLLSAEIFRVFPQGGKEARARLDKVFALLPTSRYVENMLALMSLGEISEKNDARADAPDDVVPEF